MRRFCDYKVEMLRIKMFFQDNYPSIFQNGNWPMVLLKSKYHYLAIIFIAQPIIFFGIAIVYKKVWQCAWYSNPGLEDAGDER